MTELRHRGPERSDLREGFIAANDELDPAVLGPREVLDDPNQGELADGRAPGRLLVAQSPDGLTQQRAVLGERLQQVGPLTVVGFTLDRHEAIVADTFYSVMVARCSCTERTETPSSSATSSTWSMARLIRPHPLRAALVAEGVRQDRRGPFSRRELDVLGARAA